MNHDPRIRVLDRLVNGPPEPKPIRYAIYTRQSVEKLADFSSCEAQFHTCRDFIQAMNDPLLHWCGQRFDDEGQSGSTLERPAMRKLRKVVDLGGIDRIYAVALDRVTRSMRDAVVLLDEFEKAGVDVHFVHQPELTFGAQGRFLRHVLAAFAEFERDMIATRIAESRAYLKQHGRRLAGKVPYGYDADPITKQLAPNPTEAPRVAAIFERAARGELPNNIASDINDLGWPTKVYHSMRSGKTTGGGKWTARQIVDTLRNPVYIGRFADGTDTRDGCHEPIVDQATFEAVQQQLDARRTTDGRFKRSRHDHLAFCQTIACPRCGRFLTTYQTTKRRADRTAGITVHPVLA
ncbi:MAG: recombinase family protein [Phycisphaerae bacterium]